jgi:hypothetical protein
MAIVFGIRIEGKGFDLPDLTLAWGQDSVIEAVEKRESEHDCRASKRQSRRHTMA